MGGKLYSNASLSSTSLNTSFKTSLPIRRDASPSHQTGSRLLPENCKMEKSAADCKSGCAPRFLAKSGAGSGGRGSDCGPSSYRNSSLASKLEFDSRSSVAADSRSSKNVFIVGARERYFCVFARWEWESVCWGGGGVVHLSPVVTQDWMKGQNISSGFIVLL